MVIVISCSSPQSKLIAVINSQIRTIGFQQHIRCSISTGIVIVSIKLHNFCGYRYINIQHPCALTADWCHNNRIALPLWGCDIACSITDSDCCSGIFPRRYIVCIKIKSVFFKRSFRICTATTDNIIIRPICLERFVDADIKSRRRCRTACFQTFIKSETFCSALPELEISVQNIFSFLPPENLRN